MILLLAALLSASVRADDCPDGAELRGNPPPRGSFAYCVRKGFDGRTINHGPSRMWYPGTANLRSEMMYGDGKFEGKTRRWDESGQLVEETDYVAGKRSGLMVRYRGGAKVEETHFRDGEYDGNSTAWNEQGTVTKLAEYAGGKLVTIKFGAAAAALAAGNGQAAAPVGAAPPRAAVVAVAPELGTSVFPVTVTGSAPVAATAPVTAPVTHTVAATVPAVGAGTAKYVFQKASPSIVQIAVAPNETEPYSSYGSGFVVRADGLIATNFHVVREVVLKENHSQLYLVQPGAGAQSPRIAVQAVAVDALNDLALVRAPLTRFPAALPIRTEPITPGEKVFSMGMPENLNLMIMEGIFNGFQTYSVYSKLLLSTTLNHGMSGGPTLDGDGAVAGVNVSMISRAQAISFAVPTQALNTLIASYSSRSPASYGANPLRDSILYQLRKADTTLSTEWRQATRRTTLGRWSALAPPPSMQCGRSPPSESKSGVVTEFEDCGLPTAVHLRAGISAATMEASYGHFVRGGMESTKFAKTVTEVYSLSPTMIRFVTDSKTHASALGKPTCPKEMLGRTKAGGHMFRLQLCYAPYRDFEELADFVGSALFFDEAKGDALAIVLRLQGFDNTRAQDLTLQLLQSVQKIP